MSYIFSLFDPSELKHSAQNKELQNRLASIKAKVALGQWRSLRDHNFASISISSDKFDVTFPNAVSVNCVIVTVMLLFRISVQLLFGGIGFWTIWVIEHRQNEHSNNFVSMFLKIFYSTQAAAASLLSRPRDHADVDVEAELLQGLPSIVCLFLRNLLITS